METYSNIAKAVEKFGVFPLTGEACGLGMRTLCDLSRPGADLIADFFGLPPGGKFQPNRNSGCVAAPDDHARCCHHVASIMLAPAIMQELLVYALLRHGAAAAVMVKSGEIAALNEKDLVFLRKLSAAGLCAAAALRCGGSDKRED